LILRGVLICLASATLSEVKAFCSLLPEQAKNAINKVNSDNLKKVCIAFRERKNTIP